jgi:hypothetical protein
MLEVRNIIRFDPFYFKNGNTAKPKFFIVLKHSQRNTIIASLPTRKDSIPNDENIEHGCLELPEINLNCFLIPRNTTVTECGKMFDFKTYLYGHQLDDYSVDLINEIYPNEGTDYEIWGKMKLDMFNNLIACFKNSKSVKWKYRKHLE